MVAAYSMYRRPHHRRIAELLQGLDGGLLAECECWFAGGTAVALQLDEYRRSDDIDFLESSVWPTPTDNAGPRWAELTSLTPSRNRCLVFENQCVARSRQRKCRLLS